MNKLAVPEVAPDIETICSLETVLREWLAVKEIVIICGKWDHGAISEIISDGKAWLTEAAYTGKFVGLRDLRVRGEHHHLHIDLGKFSHVEYAVTPSVCYGWKPSFEVFLVGDHGPGNFAVSAGRPYRRQALNRPLVKAFFKRFMDHRQRFGDAIQWSATGYGCGPESSAVNDCWHEIGSCALEMIPEEERTDFFFDNKKPWESVRDVMERLAG
ncbi:MAG: hypothetical protein AB2690_21755 [Candidatus Thiodiazotropha endolucinida]